MRKTHSSLSFLALSMLSFEVSAHALKGETLGLADGFLHPMIGLDHLLAMIGIGFWLGTQEHRYSFGILALLLLSLILGALLAVVPSSTRWLEPGLASSVILLGLVIAGRFPRSVGYSLSIAAGLLHGYAHGLEIPATSGAFYYGLGFLTATTLLQAMGCFLGARVCNAPWVTRLCGAVLVTAGTEMLLG